MHFLSDDTDSAAIEAREALSSQKEENVNENRETIAEVEIIHCLLPRAHYRRSPRQDLS